MTETSQREGWWLASDGRWYPPEQRPDPRGLPPPKPEPTWAVQSARDESSPRQRWLLAGFVLVLVAFAVVIAWVLFSSDDDGAGPLAVDTTSDLVAFLGFDNEAIQLTGYDPQTGIELWQMDGGPVMGWAADGRFLLAGNWLEQRASTDGALLWTSDLVPVVYPAAVVGDQIVFTTDDAVSALDYRSGEPVWSWSGLGRRAFAFGGGRIIVQDADRNIVALDATTGREQWRSDANVDLSLELTRHPRSLAYPFFGLPSYAADADVMILYEDHFDDSRDAVALDVTNGQEIWRIAGIDHRSVAILDGSAALIATDGVLVADLDTGEERWSREFANSTAVVHGDMIVLAGSDGAVGLEAATGEVRWESPLYGFVFESAGSLVVARSDSAFVGLDGATGEIEWSVDHGGNQWIPAPDPGRVTDGMLMVMVREVDDESGAATSVRLLGVDVTDGQVRWTQEVG